MAWFKLPTGTDSVSADGVVQHFEKLVDDVKHVWVEVHDDYADAFGKNVPAATQTSPPEEVVPPATVDLAAVDPNPSGAEATDPIGDPPPADPPTDPADTSANDLNAQEAAQNPDGTNP